MKPGSVAAIAVDHEGQEVLVVVLELRSLLDDYSGVVQQLRQVISEENGLVPFEIVIIQPKTIAKTTSGKISRHRVAMAYRSNTLQVLYRMQLQESEDSAADRRVKTSDPSSQLPSQLDGLDTVGLGRGVDCS